MEIVRGRSVLKRTAVGRLQYYEKEEPSVVRRQVEDTERELSRYERALEQAEKELEALYERALGEAGADSAAVFMGHRMLLKDEEYRNSVTRAITGERVNAAFAVETVGDELCRLFLEMEDEYLRARAADIRDVSDRLLRILEEEEKGGGRCGRGPALSEPVILAARDLAPSETVLLDKKKILGFVTEQGSANSHTAILARTMEIPALVSVPVAREWDGRLAAIDGEEGILYVDPDPETLERLKEKKARQEEAARLLLEIRDLTIKNDEGAVAIDKVSFYIRGGEILGVAGIAGCGQKELCEAIAGLRPIQSGLMIHKGDNIVGLPPKAILEKGISMSFIPEDRLGMGLAPSMSITDNMILKNYALAKGPFVDRKGGRADAEHVIQELEVVTPSTETPVRRLSGGNVQKVLLGREIKAGPNVIVTAYPVRGLDINSSYAIYNILNQQKKDGVGILFVGEDLDVMLALCDKIMVLCHGKVMGVVHAHKTSKEELGLMMTGALDLTYKYEDKPAGIARDTNISAQELLELEQQESGSQEGED